MPAGCQFVCQNEECRYVNTGFTINSSWPMGEIDKIIESYKEPEIIEELKKRKNEGRNYACIKLPDKLEIPIIAYRIQKYCPKCIRITDYDLVLTEEKNTLDKAYENKEDVCFACGGIMISFEKAIEEGLFCPYCNVKMTQRRWFVNLEEK